METGIVEFLDNGQLKLGLIQKASSSRLQVVDQNGKQQSLSRKQLVLQHDPGVSAEEFNGFVRDFQDRVSTLAEDIDTELLWESLESRGSDLDPEKAADLYFGDPAPPNQSALFRAAASDAIHFRQKGIRITVRTAEQVEEQKHLQEKLAEKEKLFEEFRNWATAILGSKSASSLEMPAGMLPFLNSLEQSLVDPNHNLDGNLKELIDIHSGPLRSRAEVIVELLVAGGRMPPEADPFILESGIPLEFSDETLQEASAILKDSPVPGLPDLETGPVFSIDDPDTRDLDDAISITEEGENHLLGIHVSDLTPLISPGSALDREAMSRGTSVYLPHRRIQMFPDKVSCNAASLLEKESRSSLSCMVRLGRDLEIIEWEFMQGSVRVDYNLSYSEADRIFDSLPGPTSPFPGATEKMLLLRDITDKLRSSRLAEGALEINRPESKITVEGDQIDLKMLEPESPSRRIVSELMILYNRFAGRFAADNRIPFLYRAQKAPERELPELPENGYDHFIAYQVFSMIEPGKVSLDPDRHFGLGVSAYAPLSSPIRRYGDLLNQRQLASFLQARQLPYRKEELEELLAGLSRAERTSRSLERRLNRIFALRYLVINRRKNHRAVVLQKIKSGYLVETVPECFRGILHTVESREPGSMIDVVTSKIDPESDTLLFIEDS